MNTNSDYKAINVQLLKNDQIIILEIFRPDALNTLNSQLLEEMEDFLKSFHQNHRGDYRGIIIVGSGDKSFIAGADIREMSYIDPNEAKNFGALGQRVGVLIEKLSVPVIAAVNGHALGGGLEIALSCDLILATHNATFGLPEVKLGLIPGFGGTQRLSRLIGRNRAREMIYTGKKINAVQAEELGIVLKICNNKEELIEASKKLLQEMMENSSHAISCAKKAINAGVDLPLQEGLAIELDLFINCFKSEDKQEGIGAFLEKRKPHFKK